MENVVFMAMSCEEIPDHSTIAEFISTMGIEVVPIFIQVLLICEEEGLLGGTHFSIDGLKLPSNASKEWSGKFEDGANAVVDEKHQVVAYAEAFGENEDNVHTRTMLEGAKNNLEEIGWNEPQKGLFTNEDFKYDDKIGRMICPAGVAMYTRNNNFKTVRGYKGINYQAPKTACRNCKLRVKCLRNSKTESRQVYVFYEKRSGLTDGMREKIDTPQGRKTYSLFTKIHPPMSPLFLLHCLSSGNPVLSRGLFVIEC